MSFQEIKSIIELLAVIGAAYVSLKIKSDLAQLELKLQGKFESLHAALSEKFIDKELAMHMINDLERRIERMERKP